MLGTQGSLGTLGGPGDPGVQFEYSFLLKETLFEENYPSTNPNRQEGFNMKVSRLVFGFCKVFLGYSKLS